MDAAVLKEILCLHNKWLNNEAGGVKADLSYADLRSADLRSADLSYSDLRDTILQKRPIITFLFEKHPLSFTGGDSITIGCHTHSTEKWLADFRSIGESEKYTEDQIEMYGKFIKMCSEWNSIR